MQNIFESYLIALRETPIGEHTEHTGRSVLQALLNEFKGAGATVQHEPKRQTGKGAPDFKVSKKGAILGYVEVKSINTTKEELDAILKSDQIKRYRSLSGNIILTNYLEWIWLDRERIRDRKVLASKEDLEGRSIRVSAARAEDVRRLIEGFFSEAPQGIGKSEDLAKALAVRSRLLRDELAEELYRQDREKRPGRLAGLLEVFRKQVFHELTVKDFADAFAQMLAYGLFLAKLNAAAGAVLDLDTVKKHIPGSFQLIRELVQFLDDLENDEYARMRWIVDELLFIVNTLDLNAIREDLSFRQRKAISRKVRAKDEEEHRLFERDPFIYFYEDYLKEFDPAMRKSRGVYYTPPPIVNFIVRGVDDILKDSFNIPQGLADHNRVTVLDFACGTGTFLLEVFERIFENIGGPEAGLAGPIVKQHFLQNIYGFEYLIAPYTIAHLKLSQYLKDKGHALSGKDRLKVYLTNTLEPVEPDPLPGVLPAIATEAKEAQQIKDKKILVIVGNPPYSGHSKNKGDWISKKIDDYKFTIETDDVGREARKPLGERNSKWLQDDYVKFIRFAQYKMEPVEEGVVGVITNHSWLDNPTFRGMRQSLMRSFDQIYVLDLHGSTKPKELVPEGATNENVFDIQKGVAVAIFVKKPGVPKGIWFSEFWGSRLDKYKAAAAADLKRVHLQETKCFRPYYMCRPLSWVNWDEYSEGWQIADSLNQDLDKSQIFEINVLGFQTHRDYFAIAFDHNEIEHRLRDILDNSISDQKLREKYKLRDTPDWKVRPARKAVGDLTNPAKKITTCSFRPFDDRTCYFGHELMDRPRQELLDHVAFRDNLQLLVSRQIGREHWRHAFCSGDVTESCCVSDESTEQNYCFPLWLNSQGIRTENLSAKFRSYLDERYDHPYTPEEILGYIYAVLHAPAYRSRYAEFLRIDFPRIPFPEAAGDFETLSDLGWALVQVHLLRDVPRRGLATYHGKGDHAVETVQYVPADHALHINAEQCFKPVPQEVWDFHIGGYQVLDKYLKSRKGRTLSLDEITHIGAVADALAFTIEQMQLIDAAYLKAFPGRG